MRVQRIYNDGSVGPNRTIDVNQVVFFRIGDKVPGKFIEFYLLSREALPIKLVEVGCPSEQPGFVHKIIAIPLGTRINENMVVVAD